ncbi:hypothetical protein HNQ40_002107 [Algisphaera agarilytica]|uniref:Uncharacterized protein n=1 Tax=Algisphaera agarilytica TaxID=1385975 RepID=A0A7X0H6P7_9BACT|nr:hypothetical protein [Algisphaera agarilytica]
MTKLNLQKDSYIYPLDVSVAGIVYASTHPQPSAEA